MLRTRDNRVISVFSCYTILPSLLRSSVRLDLETGGGVCCQKPSEHILQQRIQRQPGLTGGNVYGSIAFSGTSTSKYINIRDKKDTRMSVCNPCHCHEEKNKNSCSTGWVQFLLGIDEVDLRPLPERNKHATMRQGSVKYRH